MLIQLPEGANLLGLTPLTAADDLRGGDFCGVGFVWTLKAQNSEP